jgi:hypothetical protein
VSKFGPQRRELALVRGRGFLGGSAAGRKRVLQRGETVGLVVPRRRDFVALGARVGQLVMKGVSARNFFPVVWLVCRVFGCFFKTNLIEYL